MDRLIYDLYNRRFNLVTNAGIAPVAGDRFNSRLDAVFGQMTRMNTLQKRFAVGRVISFYCLKHIHSSF